MSAPLWGALVTAGVLGVTHAIEPDHVAGISSVTSQYGDSRLSALVGACFSLGHVALVVVWLVGGYLLLGRTDFPPLFDRVGTLGVAVLLGVLGAAMAVSGLRSMRHTHVHEHDGEVHVHPHFHLPLVSPDHDHTNSDDIDGDRHDIDGDRHDIDGDRHDIDGDRHDIDGDRQDIDGDRHDVDSHGDRQETYEFVRTVSEASDHDHGDDEGYHLDHGDADHPHGGPHHGHDDAVIPHAHGHGLGAYLKTGVVGALFTLSPPISMIVFASTLSPDYGLGAVALAVGAYAVSITATMTAIGACVGTLFGATALSPRLHAGARVFGGLLVAGLAASMLVGTLSAFG